MMAFQHITTEWCWGYAWTRSGLDRKTRSLINLAMLTALNRSPEVKLHVRGALNNGVTVDEIKEVLVHATVYCGIPAGLDAFKADLDELRVNALESYVEAVEKCSFDSTISSKESNNCMVLSFLGNFC